MHSDEPMHSAMAASGLGGVAFLRRKHSSAWSADDGVMQAHRPRPAAHRGLETPVSNAVFHLRGCQARQHELAMVGGRQARGNVRVPSVAEGSEMSLELVDFIAGCVGGCAGIFVGHPFDTIKVRLQSDSKGKLAGPLSATTDLIRREGLMALFKGIESPLIANVPIQALVFGAYGASLRRIGAAAGLEEGEEAPIAHHVLAGSIAGTLQVPIVCVADYCKIQLQNQTEPSSKAKRAAAGAGGKPLYSNSLQCLVHVTKAHGPTPFFRGMGMTWLRDVTYGQYFGMYEWLKRSFIARTGADADANNPLASAVAGGMSGLVGWAMAYPIDAIKTRMQAQPAALEAVSAREVARGMAAELPNYKAFTRGLGLTLVRSVPVNMVTFVVYEWVLELRAHL